MHAIPMDSKEGILVLMKPSVSVGVRPVRFEQHQAFEGDRTGFQMNQDQY